MFSGGTLATILALLAPLLKPILEAFGASLNAAVRDRRAEQNAKDLGRAEAHLDQAGGTIAAQQAELEALRNAPQTDDEAIRRLEEGSA